MTLVPLLKICVITPRIVKFKVIIGTLKLLIFAVSKFVTIKIGIFSYKWNKRNKPKDIGKLLESNHCNKGKLVMNNNENQYAQKNNHKVRDV